MQNKPNKRVCAVDGCNVLARTRGWCETHYYRWYRYGDVSVVHRPWGRAEPKPLCSVEGCDRQVDHLDMCDMHYVRVRRNGVAGPAGRLIATPGEVPAKRMTPTGYVIFGGGPRNKLRTQYEHRVVMEEVLGRPLRSNESVHHRNGVRDDNRPENLELWAKKTHHTGQRVADLVAWVVDEYPDLVKAALAAESEPSS